jgi:murein DD-endopeptidase MepM/ murein hydrolase activator NlpD
MNLVALVTALVAAFAVGQGQALRLDVPDEPGLETVAVVWNGKSIPFTKSGTGWFTLVGIDLEASPGVQTAELTWTYLDGRVLREVRQIDIAEKKFKTTRLEVESKYVELSAEDEARAARERREINDIYSQITPEALWTEPFSVPIPGVTGGRNFGHRRVFNDQPRAPHSGADLTATTGTEIRATNRGRVVLAKELFYSGNAVFVDHGLGIYSVYLHLSDIRVEPGEIIDKDQVLGLAGATGRVTGPHLHWGVRAQGARIDPFSLLE